MIVAVIDNRDEDVTRDPHLTEQLRTRGVQTVTVQHFIDHLMSEHGEEAWDV